MLSYPIPDSMTRRNLIIGALIGTTLLFAGHPARAGAVLCIGDNGHVAYESAVGGNCSEISAPGLSGAHGVETLHDGSHCGDCRDLSLTGPILARTGQRSSVKAQGSSLLSLLAPSMLGHTAGISSHGPRPSLQHSEASGLTLFATVVIQR